MTLLSDSFYMTEGDLHNVEMMTDAGDSVMSTAFTRYTAAPSATSRGSRYILLSLLVDYILNHVLRQTSKSKKKADRKRGRKGTVDEEEYIVASIAKLVGRLDQIRGMISRPIILTAGN